MMQAESRGSAINGLRQILSSGGQVLFDQVSVCANPKAGLNGGTHRGYFIVAATEHMPTLYGETIAISAPNGSTTCAVVTHVAGHIVQFRAAGARES
jgi:hypothetical protein